MDRKRFLQLGGMAMASAAMPGMLGASSLNGLKSDELFFDISLAEWSLHKALFDGKLDHLDFPATAKNEFGIDGVEYVNQFFADKAKDTDYLDELNMRCSDLDVEQVLIMIDGEGEMAVNDDNERMQAVENHYKWVEAAEYLGCHAIRVNAFGNGTPQEQKMAAVDSLGRLSEFAKDYGVSILVENHGGNSSDGQWLTDVMKQVDMDNCGTLPDLGNFCVKREGGGPWEGKCIEEYNRYKGVKEMMPYAHGVSAKSYAFDDSGQETTIDYGRVLKIVKDAGYTGRIGIEYEGDELSEAEGIRATKQLLIEEGQKISKT